MRARTKSRSLLRLRSRKTCSKLRARGAEDRERRRNEINDSAEKVFVFDKGGFTQATLERIAAVARVSRPLAYLYFPNKSELPTGSGRSQARSTQSVGLR